MKKLFHVLAICLMAIPVSCTIPAPQTEEEKSPEISFFTSDSLKIFADFYEGEAGYPILLQFHQGGSNARGEYTEIISHLKPFGYHIIAVDQCRGRQRYGSYNRNMANISLGRYSYCDAGEDMIAAVDYVKNRLPESKVILWGSSYSATLAILYAAENPEKVDGVLAFSPASGEPMEGCRPEAAFTRLEVPLLLLMCPQSEMELTVI